MSSKLLRRINKLPSRVELPVTNDPFYLAKKLKAASLPDPRESRAALEELGNYRVVLPEGFIPLSERLKEGSKR